MVVYKLLTL